MAIINTGTNFSNGEQLSASKLNALINEATFGTEAVDNSTTLVNANGAITVRDSGITTAKIANANVTFAKLTDVIDDDQMDTATDTTLATSESIKAYVDSITYIPNIVQAVKSDVSGFQNTTAMTFVDIPGLQVSITPKSANSKMLVESSISASTDRLGTTLFRLVRDGTNIGLGDVDGTATRSSFGSSDGSSYGPCTTAGSFLDSPTSIVGTPIVYKVQCTANNISVFINRGLASNSTITFARSISTLTVTEIPQ
jgi:hypothetical protein